MFSIINRLHNTVVAPLICSRFTSSSSGCLMIFEPSCPTGMQTDKHLKVALSKPKHGFMSMSCRVFSEASSVDIVSLLQLGSSWKALL